MGICHSSRSNFVRVFTAAEESMVGSFQAFPIVSVAVWITVFTCFDRCLNLLQSITKHCSTGARLFYLASVSRPQGPFDYRRTYNVSIKNYKPRKFSQIALY